MGRSGAGPHAGVLILESWDEDQRVSIAYVDGMIQTCPMTRSEAVELAKRAFGPDREPHVLRSGSVLQWRRF